MQRLSPPSRQKEPVPLAILRELRSRCNFRTSHDRVLLGAAVVGVFFLLRRSEYLADGSRVKPYIIRTKDVKFITKQGIKTDSIDMIAAVSVGSKTDQVGSETTRTLPRSGSPWLCPVLAAWDLVQIANSFGGHEALCSTAPSKVLAANTLSNAIKRAAQAIGANPTHSMRSGGATAIFTAGVDRLAIKLFGRWTSDAFERYTRMNDTVANSLARDMMQGAQPRVSPAAPEGLHPPQHSSWIRQHLNMTRLIAECC